MTQCEWEPIEGGFRCPHCGRVMPQQRRETCPARRLYCKHRGAPTGRTLNYQPCPKEDCIKEVQLPVYRCELHRLCTLMRSAEAGTGLVKWCLRCRDRTPKQANQ